MNNDYVKMTQTVKPITDNNIDSEVRKSEQEINHTEEVLIGTKQGTTYCVDFSYCWLNLEG